MNNNVYKIILIYSLAIFLSAMAWFEKIPSEAYIGLVSAAIMSFINSKKIEELQTENKTLNEQITVLSKKNFEVITEDQIKIKEQN